MRGLGVAACFALLLLATAGTAAAREEERPLPAPAPVADDALAEALEAGELTEAEYALERARSIFQLGRVRREFGDVARPAAHDATLILRDLAVRLTDLSGSERIVAKRLLARPPQGAHPDLPGNGWSPGAPEAVYCGLHVCIHWVNAIGDEDAPDLTDNPPNGIPDWVELTLQTWEDVWSAEIDAVGYRPPLSDETSPNGDGPELDVYLEELGEDLVFGYCTSDDPNASPNVAAVSAYCVIDDDFAEFGGQTPEAFLQVTSAHEFHHASQFAYDWLEDYWLMEGTAANIEETVYPAINDNVFFLRFWSPLSRPGSPLDRGGFGDSEYGSWIFWRFLEEKIAGNSSILREIWDRAAPVDVYSLLAVRRELTERGVAFRDAFVRFGVANRLRDYADAQNAGYPWAPLTKTYTVSPTRPLIRWTPWRIDHLATRYLAFRRGKQVKAGASLWVRVQLPKYGARAAVIVVDTDGSRVAHLLEQNADGYARAHTRFGRGVKRVELVLSNGSTRIRSGSCWQDQVEPYFSCLGRPLDDRRVFQLRAKLGT
ncbi:MAG: MXAN_6640 family putative metalloprotease [Gaiellaceae bacterium]